MRTGLLAGVALAALLSGAVQAAETRVITIGRLGPGDSEEKQSTRVVPPGSQVIVRQQRGVTIIAPVRQAPRTAQRSSGRAAEDELVHYADGSVALRNPPPTPQPVVGAYAAPPPQVVVVPLPGYGARGVVYR